MSVKTMSVRKAGRDFKISPHFRLGEFASKDGADKTLYSTELLAMLEKLRAYGGFTITVNSGYRSPVYNRKIGGASRSQHVKGTAADIMVRRQGAVVNARLICCLCQTLGFRGVAYISPRAVHVDMRPTGRYRGDERKGYGNNVDDFYRYFNVKKAEVEALAVNNSREETEGKTVTQEDFKRMMALWLKEQGEAAPSAWSEKERRWGEALGLVRGDENGDFRYQSFCTREQVVAMAIAWLRLWQKGRNTPEGNSEGK